MEYITNNFLGIAVLVGIVNGLVLRKKILMISSGNEGFDIDPEKKLIKGIFGSLTIPFALLQIIQLLSGYKSAFYIFFKDYTNPFYWAGVSVLVISWLLFLYWIFLKKGYLVLKQYNKAFNLPKSESGIKLFSLVVVLGGAVALFLV